MIESLSWLPNKSGFIDSKSLETLINSPNIPASLKVLEQKVHELVNRGFFEPRSLLGQRCMEQKA